MVVGLLLLGSLAVNALIAVAAFGRFAYYDGPSSERPDSPLFAGVAIGVGLLELGVYAYAAVQAVQTGAPNPGTLGFLALNALLILAFALFLERSSVRAATGRLLAVRSGP